jgi:hypothetical protein
MRISHVTAIADGDDNARNVAIAVLGFDGGAPILTDVTARTEPSSFTTARAIEVGDGASPLLVNVTAVSAGQALSLVGGDADTVTVRNSLLSGAGHSVVTPNIAGSKVINVHASQLEGTLSAAGTGNTVNLAASQLDGAVVEAGGTVTCVFVYDGTFGSHSCNP